MNGYNNKIVVVVGVSMTSSAGTAYMGEGEEGQMP